MSTRWLAVGLVFLGSGLGAPAAVAQDIEAVAEMRGLRLPDAYYRRVAQDPMAFRLPNGLFRAGPSGVEQVRPVSGTHRVVVLPALFGDSPEPHVTREMIQGALFDGPAPYGTITEAYTEISRGQLTLLGDVLPWVRTSRPMIEAVGTENGLGADSDLGPYFIEALSLADPDVDFGQYDNDGPDNQPNSGDDDGFVDAMVFEYLEIAGSCGGPSIWPHRFGIAPWNDGAPYQTDDPRPGGGFVQVNGYITQSATACDGIEIQTANTIAHEYGHVLGLPDFYHPTASGGALGRRWVLGCWELMAAGSWGCGPHAESRDPFGPTHLSARNKNLLGWLSFTDVPLGGVVEQEFVLNPVQSSARRR